MSENILNPEYKPFKKSKTSFSSRKRSFVYEEPDMNEELKKLEKDFLLSRKAHLKRQEISKTG